MITFHAIHIYWEILNKEGFKCIRAKNGKEAIDYCKTNKKIDLLLHQHINNERI